MNTVPLAALTRRGLATRRRRLVVIVSAVLTLLASYVVIASATSANAAVTLLSAGKPVTASSAENAGTAAANAVDGNTGTRWSSAFSDPQWIQIDLGPTASVGQVGLPWEAAYATAYQIQPSADGNAWTTIYSTPTSAGGNQTLTVSGPGRYLRMNGTARATQFGYSLW